MGRTTTLQDELAEVLERHVRSRTFGQIRDLSIEVEGCSVVLRGRVDRYYVKQLAQHAALEVERCRELVNEIVVATLPSLTTVLPRP